VNVSVLLQINPDYPVLNFLHRYENKIVIRNFPINTLRFIDKLQQKSHLITVFIHGNNAICKIITMELSQKPEIFQHKMVYKIIFI
jgi:hypothetical protein